MAIYKNTKGHTGADIDALLVKAGTAVQPTDQAYIDILTAYGTASSSLAKAESAVQPEHPAIALAQTAIQPNHASLAKAESALQPGSYLHELETGPNVVPGHVATAGQDGDILWQPSPLGAGGEYQFVRTYVSGYYYITKRIGTHFFITLNDDTEFEFAEEPGQHFYFTIAGGNTHTVTWPPNLIFVGGPPPGVFGTHELFHSMVAPVANEPDPYRVLTQYLGSYAL